MKKHPATNTTLIWSGTVAVLALLLGLQTWRVERQQQQERAAAVAEITVGGTAGRQTTPGFGRKDLTGGFGKKANSTTGKPGNQRAAAAIGETGSPQNRATVTPPDVSPASVANDSSAAYSLISQAKDALDRGDDSAAITLLNQALEKDPTTAGAYLMLAGICRNLGLLEEERQLYLDWAKASPQASMPHYYLANFLQQQGRLDEALAAARQFIDLSNPNDLNSYLLGASLYRTLKQPEEERKLLESWVAAKPQLADSHRALAEFFQRTGDDAGALTEYQAACDAAPGRWDINLQLATLYQKLQKYTEAEQQLIQAANLRPADMWIRLRLADTYRQAGNNLAATGVYQQIINYSPDSAEARTAASRLNALQGSSP